MIHIQCNYTAYCFLYILPQDYACIWTQDGLEAPELVKVKLEWETFENFVKAIREVILGYMIDIYDNDQSTLSKQQVDDEVLVDTVDVAKAQAVDRPADTSTGTNKRAGSPLPSGPRTRRR